MSVPNWAWIAFCSPALTSLSDTVTPSSLAMFSTCAFVIIRCRIGSTTCVLKSVVPAAGIFCLATWAECTWKVTSWSSCCLVMCVLPTTATSPLASEALEPPLLPPPQAAETATAVSSTRGRIIR